MVSGSGLRVLGSWFRGSVSGFQVRDFTVQGCGLWFRVRGSSFGVSRSGSGFWRFGVRCSWFHSSRFRVLEIRGLVFMVSRFGVRVFEVPWWGFGVSRLGFGVIRVGRLGSGLSGLRV